MAKHRDTSIGADLIKGAVAGAAATWIMGLATTWMYERESQQARDREEQARGGRSPSTAMHWAIGIGAGALYAGARRRWPTVARQMGLRFGSGLFVVADEVMNPALGFTPGPKAFPWQAHARGLGGHLTYGMVTELVLEGLDAIA